MAIRWMWQTFFVHAQGISRKVKSEQASLIALAEAVTDFQTPAPRKVACMAPPRPYDKNHMCDMPFVAYCVIQLLHSATKIKDCSE